MPRISASSYSNTAPLIWSFLYGSNHGRVEIILDNAPARSAELLQAGRVDAALAPVAAYQTIDEARIVPGVCVGAKERAGSVCLVSKMDRLDDTRTVALDVSSRTSVLLTKIIFREFLGFEPQWRPAAPDIKAMLKDADVALLIGDPALRIAARPEPGAAATGFFDAETRRSGDTEIDREAASPRRSVPSSPRDPAASAPGSDIRVFDLAALWREHTGLGFIFAMWMTTREKVPVDFAAARDEGLRHVEEIVSNYESEIALGREEMLRYLTETITYEPDESMMKGMKLYFELAERHGLIPKNKPLSFV